MPIAAAMFSISKIQTDKLLVRARTRTRTGCSTCSKSRSRCREKGRNPGTGSLISGSSKQTRFSSSRREKNHHLRLQRYGLLTDFLVPMQIRTWKLLPSCRSSANHQPNPPEMSSRHCWRNLQHNLIVSHHQRHIGKY